MLIEDLITVPNSSIVNSILPKNDIFEATKMNKRDKEYFVRYVKQIRWLYKFDNESIRIKPYEDDLKSYEKYRASLFKKNCGKLFSNFETRKKRKNDLYI